MLGSSVAADASRVVTSQMLQVNGGRLTKRRLREMDVSY